MRPIIGLTTDRRMVRSSAGETRAHAVYTTYTTMVAEAGGTPVLLVPVPEEDIPTLLDRLDGVVFTGGGDVDPSRYGGTIHDTMYGVDPLRDEFEIALARAVSGRSLPTLAICRGLQVVNVALGGSLIEDIPSEIAGDIGHRRHGPEAFETVQSVKLLDGSLVAEALGDSLVRVNSIHHQSVRRVAAGLEACGWAEDGAIEALTSTEGWPLLGVQWHPEYLGPGDDPSRRLFEALVSSAAG